MTSRSLTSVLPGPFAPPGAMRPRRNITARSYSWTTCTDDREQYLTGMSSVTTDFLYGYYELFRNYWKCSKAKEMKFGVRLPWTFCCINIQLRMSDRKMPTTLTPSGLNKVFLTPIRKITSKFPHRYEQFMRPQWPWIVLHFECDAEIVVHARHSKTNPLRTDWSVKIFRSENSFRMSHKFIWSNNVLHDFLLALCSNCNRILHRFRDIARCWSPVFGAPVENDAVEISQRSLVWQNKDVAAAQVWRCCLLYR